MSRLSLCLCLVLAADIAAGQQPTLLRKGDNVRLWSARRHLLKQNGWMESLTGSVLSLRVPADAHLETDELYTTLILDTAEIDTLEVQRDGAWWRANFSGLPFTLVDPRAHSDNVLERIPLYTRVRVWSPLNQLDGNRGVLVDVRADTIDVHFAPGEPTPPRALAITTLQRVQVPRERLAYTTGVWRGAITGAVLGVITALATESCAGTGPTDAIHSPQCAVFSKNAVPYGLVGAAAGSVAGAVYAWWTRSRWTDVALP